MIEIQDLCVRLGEFRLKDVTFDVQDGEYFVLLGPTGSGKTVLLESIAGLNPVISGKVIINDRDVTSLNLEKRNIGFAYQDYTLYRHLSVRDNISFGLQWRNKPRADIEKSIDNVIELLGITPLLDRRPWSLSGGESQKIALARALALKPNLLLLDEPMSAVDPQLKEATEKELKRAHDNLTLTTIHVTHDFEEAMALGDRIAIMEKGNMVQIGTPEQIFRHPNSEFVARFVMTRNIFKGEVSGESNGKSFFDMENVKLAVLTDKRGNQYASIRPEDIVISTEPMHSSNCDNNLEGIITNSNKRGS
ncbi:MAG: ABC transporter ATP-binding protein, partial [Dehalococcoidales bacterium]|nr:ABC transporter ATP-binding protein [Dehalococcoidales bacterium]